MTVDDRWRDLVTAALLGTDRREPPIDADTQIGDVVADAVRADDAGRMLAAVAATAAVRRAAFVALPAAAPLQPPVPDDRPWCSPSAVETWREVVSSWPVLEDEWVLRVIENGLRLPPDAVAELFERHRRDAVRRARAAIAAGPVGAWLSGQLPDYSPPGGTVNADAVMTLPDLPVPPELADLLDADAHTFARRLGAGFDGLVFGQAHKAVLVNLIARCRPEVLVDAAATLDATHVGLALALADLARLRHRMLIELTPTPAAPTPNA